MKKLAFVILIITVIFSCKKEPSCSNGVYDEGEIGIDCGGVCSDCIFDKNEILEKEWIDVDTSTHLREHIFLTQDQFFGFHWDQAGIGLPSGPGAFTWQWVNESDTIQFNYRDYYNNQPIQG